MGWAIGQEAAVDLIKLGFVTLNLWLGLKTVTPWG